MNQQMINKFYSDDLKKKAKKVKAVWRKLIYTNFNYDKEVK